MAEPGSTRAPRGSGSARALSIGARGLRPVLGGGDPRRAPLSHELPAPDPRRDVPAVSRRAGPPAATGRRPSTGRWWRCRCVALGWPIVDRAAFPYRSATPTAMDVLLGTAAILLVLEATRRTAGWILAATAALFIVYAYVGPLLDLVGLSAIGHRGYYPDRLVGTLYMTLDGIFGVPLEVAATYIVLFTVYGAVLEHSGAGRFFIDWSLAAMGRSRVRRGAGPQRHHRRVPPRHGLRQRRGDHGHPRLPRLADPPPRRLLGGDQRRDLRRRRHRGRPLPADAGRGRVPARGVPGDLVPAGPGGGDGADAPLLPLRLPDDRGRLARAPTSGPVALETPPLRELTAALRLSLPVPDRRSRG